MSCSARLPIYVLFSGMFFPGCAMLVAYSMYVLGIVVAIAAALVMHLFTKKKEINTLLIELPEYKSPNLHSIAIYTWEKVEDYLRKAGTTIFAASIVLWVILNFGPGGMATDMSMSFGAMAGRIAAPLMKPAGLGYWQVVVALIAGLAAKEVVVSSMSVLFGITNVTSVGNGRNADSPCRNWLYGGKCLCLNDLLPAVYSLHGSSGHYSQGNELLKWTAFGAVLQLVIAWIVAMVVYRIGMLL